MEMEKIINNYLKALEEGNYEEIISLFAPHALVLSPLYGKVKAIEFYRDLLQDTSNSNITLMNTFTNPSNTRVGAGHFRYDWTMKDGTPTSFECVDIFYLNAEQQIEKLSIIYDTASTTRKAFENLDK